MNIFARLLCCVVLVMPLSALADVEKTVKYRQSVYQVIVWNFSTIKDMAAGERAFDADLVKRNAIRIAQMSRMLDDAYAERSTAENSDAKREIWENPEEFNERLNAFQVEAAKLAEVSHGGDQGAIVDQFKDLAGACKACHDKFKE